MSAEEAGRIARAAERVRRGTRMPLKVLVPTVAAIGAGGGFAAASIPGSNGVITACYSTEAGVIDNNVWEGGTITEELRPTSGSLRVIDPSAAPETVTNIDSFTDTAPAYNSSCAPWEKTITWNQQGPPGVPGPPGKNGTNGANGSNGANGQNASILGNATFEIDAGGGSELFAKFAGIPGTLKLAGEAGAIGLQSFAFGATSPVSSAFGTGAGAGKVSIQSFEITKKIDKSSPVLFKDLQTAKVIAKLEVDAAHVAIKGESSQKAPTEDAQYIMSNVRLKSIRQSGSNETVIGIFQKMQSSIGTGNSKITTQLNPTGALGWDIATNKAS